jgi:anti-sigma regulatory factor (Ser/Thr protein kinase)
MTGRPDGGASPTSTLIHDALLYDHDGAYLDGVRRFVDASVDLGEALLVAVPDKHAALLRSGIGPAAEFIEFIEMEDVGRNPRRIIPTVMSFVDDHPSGVGFVDEPIWPGRSAAEVAEAVVHEALINLAFAESPIRILCAYDVGSLEAEIVDDAWRTHPRICEGGRFTSSSSYADPELFSRAENWPLPEPAPDAVELVLEPLGRVRLSVMQRCVEAGVGQDATEDFVLAINEVATNTLEHAGGLGFIRLWTAPGDLVCEVHDAGWISDPLAGRHVPSIHGEGGRGLWLANQLCDLVELRSDHTGTTVRLHLYLP